MSQENVETVAAVRDALNAADVDAFLGCLHPEVEWAERSDAVPDVHGVYRGRAEVRRWLEGFLDAWESLQLDDAELIPASDDRVLWGLVVRLRGKFSGVETEGRFWTVFWFADGKIVRREAFLVRAEALEAVGLSE